MTKTFTLQDGTTSKQFDGVKLAFATSHRADKERWSELTIYRTVSGQFVAHGIGRSRVQGEVDRSWVNVAVDADALITVLTRESDEGVRFMPHINRRALEIASVGDNEVRTAYNLQYID